MDVLLYGLAVLLSLLLIAGWVMLLTAPLIALTGATVGGVSKGVTRVRQSLPALSRRVARGILCIDGLVSEPALLGRLRSDIVRVLRLAPAETRPRACACVKESGSGFVGVLRIFNKRGHYLLRASGETRGSVARRFSAALDEFVDVFPARQGARRVSCPECDPKTCPLRLRKELRALATA
jgi:hypothetical protein